MFDGLRIRGRVGRMFGDKYGFGGEGEWELSPQKCKTVVVTLMALWLAIVYCVQLGYVLLYIRIFYHQRTDH